MNEHTLSALQRAVTDAAPTLGAWHLEADPDRVMLVWTCVKADWPVVWYGDEPWTKQGGDELITIAGTEPDKWGIDSDYDTLAHWAQWDR